MNWVQWMQETPFGRSTRQNLRTIDNLGFDQGNSVSRAIPRVGYLARLFLHLNGTLNVTLGGGTATLDALGPWNILNRIRIAANSGQDIIAVSGYGAHLLSQVAYGADYDLSDGKTSSPLSYAASIYSAGVAGGNNTWNVPFVIPVALNEMSEAGLILLQNELALTQLILQWNSSIYNTATTVAPVVVTGAATATFTGTVTPVVEYFAVPADPKAQPDILWIHQVLEFSQPVAATGDQQINLLRDNIYLQILHHVILNGAPNTSAIERIRLVINQSDTPYDLPLRNYLLRQRHLYRRDLPVGTFVHDLMHQGIPGYGGERDLLNGRATSELQSILTIASGTTLGTNPRISTITRQLVRLATPPSQAA